MIIQITFLLATVFSLVLPLYAAFTGRPRAAYVAAALSLPYCYYVAGAPSTYYVPLIFPLLTASGGTLLRARRTIALWLLFFPYAITLIWLVLAA